MALSHDPLSASIAVTDMDRARQFYEGKLSLVERAVVRRGEPTARLRGSPGEVLLYLFGRQPVAQVEIAWSADAVATVERTKFGM